MQWQATHGGPEIQGITAGAAGEAVIELAGEMHREASMRRGATTGDWAEAAKLGAAPPSRLKTDQAEHLGHRHLLANLMVVNARHDGVPRRMALVACAVTFTQHVRMLGVLFGCGLDACQVVSCLGRAGGLLARWAR
jgi:hypothetical protein